jgi:hypothetical protein
MATMKLMFEGNVEGEYKLPPGKTLTIGRRNTNDIVVENLVVSGAHAKIDALEEGYLLTDLRSKNGTFVNETPVSNYWLQDGDVVRIGKHTLTLALDAAEAFSLDVADDGMEQTMVFGTGEFRPNITQPKAPAYLTFLKGGQGEIPLTKKLVKIGKDFSNDVVVSGFTVGPTAATISKQPEGYYISYVGGFSKPKVNGKTIGESLMLQEFDVIEIGSAKLEFLLK